MALITLRQLLDHAAEHGYGLPAFNVNNMEQIHAIMQAADAVDSPVILQGSAGARSYAGEPFLRHLVAAAVEAYPHIPICMHQDHGASPGVCMRSIQSGFSSVMMDGSLLEDGKTPASYEYNVRVTRQVADIAHACGVSVEGELGCLGSLETGKAGEEDGHGAEGELDHSMLLTDPDEAADFVQKTQVDALAIAIGTSHGAYKFTQKPTGKVLRIDRVKAIHARIPNVHLVMHGSSACRRTGWPSSTPTAATWARPTACRWRRSSRASSMVCARSTSTPTCAWPPPGRSANTWPRTARISTRASSSRPRPRR